MCIAPESELGLLLAHVPPKVTWAEFRHCRNDIVKALTPFGSVGPVGVLDEDGEQVEIYGRRRPAFFVVDDMYNDTARLHLIEAKARLITEPMLESLAQALSRNGNWAAKIAVGDAGLYVFADRIVPGGRRFWDCDSVGAIVERCSKPVDFGPVPAVWAEGYELWRDLICGDWRRDRLPAAPDRQWAYVINTLSETNRISEFTYRKRLLYELHPATRLEFVSRFFEDVQGGRESSSTGIETVAQDAGELLFHIDEAASNRLLLHLKSIQDRLPRKEAFYLWGIVAYGCEHRDGESGSYRLASFLRNQIESPSGDLALLGALLGLACLKHPEVSSLASQLSLRNSHWDAPIHAWLRQLSAGRSGYAYPLKDIDLSNLR